MSSAAPAELGRSDRLHQVVRKDEIADSDGCADKEARNVQCAWRDSVPVECSDNEDQTPKLPLLGEPCEVTGYAERNHITTDAGESVAYLERSVDQIDPASQTPGSHDEQAVPPGSSLEREAVGSTRLLRGEETHHQAHEVRSMPVEDVTEVHTGETVENQELGKTPLFGTSSGNYACLTAQGSAPPLGDPAPHGLKVMMLSASREQLLHPTPPTQQLRLAHPAAPNALPGQPLGDDMGHPLADPNLTPIEEVVLSSEKNVRDGDAQDAYEGGNEPASGSSWCLSVSTGSDTRSDAPHVLQSHDVHRQPHASLQQRHLTPQTQAPKEETAQLLTRIGTSADACSSPKTSEGSHSLLNGRCDVRISSVRENKQVHSETNQHCVAYGKAKVANDVLAGLVGMQPVAIINCFVCDAALGGVLSMFCLFSSAFAHFDKRPASYLLCSLFAFALANTMVIALTLELAGFESFHTVEQLRRMSIAHTVVLFFLSVLAGGLGVRSLWASSARGESCCVGKHLKDQKCERRRP